METDNTIVPAVRDLPMLPMEAVSARFTAINRLVKEAMKEGIHYGKIPGVEKPCILKPGCEMTRMLFQLRLGFQLEIKELGGGHREYIVYSRLIDGRGEIVGEGTGSCSTMESKYRWRKGERKCPKCGHETIIKGKADYGGGWLCWGKRGGCGAKFSDHDPAVVGQQVERIENPDIADAYNTCLKMAKKRADADVTLSTTGMSALFTQDVDDTDVTETPPPSKSTRPRAPVAASEPEKSMTAHPRYSLSGMEDMPPSPFDDIEEDMVSGEVLTTPAPPVSPPTSIVSKRSEVAPEDRSTYVLQSGAKKGATLQELEFDALRNMLYGAPAKELSKMDKAAITVFLSQRGELKTRSEKDRIDKALL